MPFVIVEIVTNPQAVAEALIERGDDDLAREVTTRGRGEFVLDTRKVLGLSDLPAHDRERAERELDRVRAARATGYGISHHLRTDFDPLWEKQHRAARAAIAAVLPPRERCAIPAVNAFKRSYYTDWGSEWDTPDPRGARWAAHHARNFRDGAIILGNALAGLRMVDGEMARADVLAVTARLGWDGVPLLADAQLREELWLAYSLGRTLRKCGDGRVDHLLTAFERGSAGHN